jgi:hypothetical protein
VKNVYALDLAIEVSLIEEAAERWHLVCETLTITYTRQIYIYIYICS